MSPTDPAAEKPYRILLIEDSEVDRRWLRARLAGEQIELVEATDGPTGLEACASVAPDLILLDLGLPLFDGFEILHRLKDDRRTSSIPVIVVSAASETKDKERGLDLGAVDFVTKPYDLVELRARIRVAMRTKRLRDVLEQRAHIDGLTGLANRLALEERLATEWALQRRHGAPLAIWIADLDHFKCVNDAHGHPAGDEVLRRTAAALRTTVRATDLAARYGGEEFVVIAPFCGIAGAAKTAERFRNKLAAMSISTGASTIRVTASVGVTSLPEDDAESPSALLVRADSALYRAKALGRNQVQSSISGNAVRVLTPA
jgi:diguanylate cyclase (GGDEF)-like protein